MTQEEHRARFKEFVQDLSVVLKKHQASLWYTNADDGIHVETADMFHSERLGFITNGTSEKLERVLKG